MGNKNVGSRSQKPRKQNTPQILQKQKENPKASSSAASGSATSFFGSKYTDRQKRWGRIPNSTERKSWIMSQKREQSSKQTTLETRFWLSLLHSVWVSSADKGSSMSSSLAQLIITEPHRKLQFLVVVVVVETSSATSANSTTTTITTLEAVCLDSCCCCCNSENNLI